MKAVVRKMQQGDIPRTVRLFSKIVDELHQDDSEETRESYKEKYTPERLTVLLNQDERVYWLVESDDRIVGFLFGWIIGGVGYIHWLGVVKGCRKRGYGKALMEKAIAEFEGRGCYQIEVFIYSKLTRLYRFFKQFDFERKGELNNNLFGVAITYMIKRLTDLPDARMTKCIVIVGTAGQGVKLIGQVLANILTQMQKEVSLNVVYGASVRAGLVRAELVYSELPIDMPFIEEADLLLQLANLDEEEITAKHIIKEARLAEEQPCGNHRGFGLLSFERISTEKFGTPLFMNMVALGRLLDLIGINIEIINFTETSLPLRFFDKNVEAIQFGYTYLDHVV